MKKVVVHGIFGVLFCTFAGAASAEPMAIAPQVVPLKVLGVALSVPASGQVDIHTEASRLVVAVKVLADLADLQAKALPIARAISLPQNRCANKTGLNAVIDSIDDAKIAGEGSDARLTLTGHVTAYACVNHLGYTIVGSGTVTADAKVKIEVVNGKTLSVALDGPVTVGADGLTGAALGLVQGQVNDAVTKAVGKALDASRTSAVFPEVAGLDVTIGSAGFATGTDGKLTLAIDAAGSLTADGLNAVLSRLAKAPGGQ